MKFPFFIVRYSSNNFYIPFTSFNFLARLSAISLTVQYHFPTNHWLSMILPNFSFTFPKIVHHSINIRSLPPLVGTAPLVLYLYTSWETKRCLLTLIQNTPFFNSNKTKCTKTTASTSFFFFFFWSPLLRNIMLITNVSANKHQS